MIDKNKAYRFRGDNERVEWDEPILAWSIGTEGWIDVKAAKKLHERGILLEYPELPGEDWEYCEFGENTFGWVDSRAQWMEFTVTSSEIYCRKKKPVITEVEVVVFRAPLGDGMSVWLDPSFAGPGDRVKVTKL